MRPTAKSTDSTKKEWKVFTKKRQRALVVHHFGRRRGRTGSDDCTAGL